MIRCPRRIFAASLVVALAGCHASGQPYETPQQAACRSQGYRPGTDAYVTCLQNEVFWTQRRL